MAGQMRVTTGRSSFRAEVADSFAEKRRGLQGHPGLGEDEAMFFPYAKSMDADFIMGQVTFPIDIVFLRRTGSDGEYEVVKACTNVQPGDPRTFSCGRVDAVLETAGGKCRNLGLGDRVHTAPLELIARTAAADDDPLLDMLWMHGPCSKCNGSGTVKKTCDHCGGSGQEPKAKSASLAFLTGARTEEDVFKSTPELGPVIPSRDRLEGGYGINDAVEGGGVPGTEVETGVRREKDFDLSVGHPETSPIRDGGPPLATHRKATALDRAIEKLLTPPLRIFKLGSPEEGWVPFPQDERDLLALLGEMNDSDWQRLSRTLLSAVDRSPTWPALGDEIARQALERAKGRPEGSPEDRVRGLYGIRVTLDHEYLKGLSEEQVKSARDRLMEDAEVRERIGRVMRQRIDGASIDVDFTSDPSSSEAGLPVPAREWSQPFSAQFEGLERFEGDSIVAAVRVL